MAKISGAYDTVVRGVSQQVPQNRLSGQHGEQVNMVPDPVHGLSRRHGSVTVAEAALPHPFATLLINTASHLSHQFRVDGVGYDLLYRSAVRPLAEANQSTLFCFNRGSGAFLPVVLHGTAATAALSAGGVSAVTQIGRYVLMAGNTVTTTWTSSARFANAANQSHLAVWVRNGAYSRTFSIILTDKITGVQSTISYTTKASSYPTLLDTTAILTSSPDYQKQINDAITDYNSRATAWIGEAAADIVPDNIAEKLALAYNANVGWGTATVRGSTLLINSTKWSDIAVDDAGDNSLIAAVGNTVDTLEDMCPAHWVGKIVRVRPSKDNPEAAFYLEAYAKDEQATGISDVIWRESAGIQTTPGSVFIIGTVYAGTLYVSDDLVWLEAQVGAGFDDVPNYPASPVGDDFTAPLPAFLGKTIDFLGVFQDRLVVGSGPVVSASRPGDYFNFFRASVLTVKDDDPVEITSLGSEEDVIRYATMFNRDLILYGKRGQYIISGRQPLTPKTAGIVATASSHEDAIDAAPKASGAFVFFAKKRGPVDKRVTSLHQIQPAALSDNPDSTDLSQQLNDYVAGTAVEVLPATTPNTVMLRTTASRTGLYLYNYLDRGNGERVLDAWHRWTWEGTVGHLIGIAPGDTGGLYAFVVRQHHAGASWIACERFELTGSLSTRPYLDAMRLYAAPGAFAGSTNANLSVAYGAGANAFEGVPLVTVGAAPMTGAYLGTEFSAYVTPTNPYPKDRQGQTITFGRFTLGSVRLSVADTGGLVVSTDVRGSTHVALDFNGFSVGGPGAVLGTQPIVTTQLQAWVGGEVRECSFTVTSKRWLPLTVTSIEWSGQVFNRQRRA